MVLLSGRHASLDKLFPPRLTFPAILVLIAGIFVLDMLTPLDYEVWVLYLFPIFFSTRLRFKWAPVAVGAVCVGLSTLGAFLSPPDIPMGEDLVHHSLETLTLAIAALLLFQRKQAETAQRKLAAIVESSDDAIVGKTLDGIITSWNKAAECLFGFTAQDVIGKPITLLLPRDRTDEETQIIERIKQGERIDHFETIRQRKDGKLIDVSLSISPIRDAEGAIIGISKIARDITERKRAEEALCESEERFRLIMEHANDAIFYIDLNGEIHWASYRAEVLTGQPRAKFLGRTIMTLLAPESVPVAEARLAAVRRGEAVAPLVEIAFLCPDGLMIWAEANITSVQQDGNTIGRLLVVRDITERKRAEEAMRKSEQELCQLLEERERMSQNLHDNIIQTLYAIGLGLEESQRLIGGDSKTAVTNLSHAVRDLNAVIRDVRCYILGSEPAISSGQQLKVAIEHLAQRMAGAHLLEFRLQVDPMAANRLAPEEVNHVLYIVREAMSNSLRHSGGRSGFVALQSRNGYVRLEVEDDGVGFDVQAKQERGTGLRNLVARAEKLGAQLEVVSKPGRGTRVVLNIPQESEHASA